MAEKKEEERVEIELLADRMKFEGVEYSKGDLAEIPKSSEAALRRHGSVGDPGTLEKIQEAQAARDAADAQAQALLTGGSTPEEYSKAQSEAAEKRAEVDELVEEQRAAGEEDEESGGAHAAPKPAARRPGRRPAAR